MLQLSLAPLPTASSLPRRTARTASALPAVLRPKHPPSEKEHAGGGGRGLAAEVLRPPLCFPSSRPTTSTAQNPAGPCARLSAS